jgi:hypothetical protein
MMSRPIAFLFPVDATIELNGPQGQPRTRKVDDARLGEETLPTGRIAEMSAALPRTTGV